MSGLVCRDLLAFYRKNSKITYIMEVVCLLFFLFAIPGIYGGITFLVIVAPMNMCGLPMILKEIDTNYKGLMTAMTLPYSKKDIVKARFLSAFANHLFYLAEMLIFSILHLMIKGTLSFKILLVMMAGGWLTAIFMTSINLLASFTSGMNVTTILYLILMAILVGGYLLFMLTGIYDFLLAFIGDVSEIWLWAAAILANALVLFISFRISVRKFEKRN